MRNVAGLLGIVVTTVLSGCGGKQDDHHGTLAPDGTVTSAGHVLNDDGCDASVSWTYDLDPSFTCEELTALAKRSTCEALCGDPAAACGFPRQAVPGGGPGYIDVGAQYDTGGSCPPMPTTLSCEKIVPASGHCSSGNVIEGRRPDGLRALEGDAYRSLGDYFAHAAHLEAAAVLAFERLGEELRAHGAPRGLCERVAQAEKEERRHVVLASGLARRFGAEPPPAVAESTSRRTLFAIAHENVIEGVVRETYGAAVAIHRARRAADEEVRETLAVIAADECRHAELSWDLHEWMLARLTEQQRAAIEDARRDALLELSDALARAEPSPELALLAGVPSRRDAIRLFDAVAAVLWRAAA